MGAAGRKFWAREKSRREKPEPWVDPGMCCCPLSVLSVPPRPPPPRLAALWTRRTAIKQIPLNVITCKMGSLTLTSANCHGNCVRKATKYSLRTFLPLQSSSWKQVLRKKPCLFTHTAGGKETLPTRALLYGGRPGSCGWQRKKAHGYFSYRAAAGCSLQGIRLPWSPCRSETMCRTAWRLQRLSKIH